MSVRRVKSTPEPTLLQMTFSTSAVVPRGGRDFVVSQTCKDRSSTAVQPERANSFNCKQPGYRADSTICAGITRRFGQYRWRLHSLAFPGYLTHARLDIYAQVDALRPRSCALRLCRRRTWQILHHKRRARPWFVVQLKDGSVARSITEESIFYALVRPATHSQLCTRSQAGASRTSNRL